MCSGGAGDPIKSLGLEKPDSVCGALSVNCEVGGEGGRNDDRILPEELDVAMDEAGNEVVLGTGSHGQVRLPVQVPSPPLPAP